MITIYIIAIMITASVFPNTREARFLSAAQFSWRFTVQVTLSLLTHVPLVVL